ncbi:MAG: asparaginase [Proteobacteria bacterium]|nr:asparaginase [Pseudomonadota bacterium]
MTPESENTRPGRTPRACGDRESLSALFDGELQGDAARFALKRLGHDSDWRQTCGRWQLAGDVLRGQAAGLAPGGFAERVAQAVADETVDDPGRLEAPLAAVGTRQRSHRNWLPSAALAASVAVVALLVARPLTETTAPDSPAVAPQIAVTAPADAGAAPSRAPADAAAGLAAAAVAAVEVPRRNADRRSRAQSQRAALRARQTLTSDQAPALAVAGGSSASTPAIALAPAPSTTASDRVAAARRLAAAMTAQPWMVAGTDRIPTDLLTAAAGGVIVKDGAEGVFAAALPDGSAAAVKVMDGATRGAVPGLVVALRALVIAAPVLDELATSPVLGCGRPVGELRPR